MTGTLVPIAARPSLAKLPEYTELALTMLSRKKRVQVGIVSGRSLCELRRLVGLRDIAYIGSHGYELRLPGQPLELKVLFQERQRLRLLAQELQWTLKGLGGPCIEQKVACVAVHYRLASQATIRETLHLLHSLAQNQKKNFRVQEGRRVFEFVPAGAITKGTTVRELLSRSCAGQCFITMYFGDDLSDESVFATLRARDFGILIGQPRPTKASITFVPHMKLRDCCTF